MFGKRVIYRNGDQAREGIILYVQDGKFVVRTTEGAVTQIERETAYLPE